MSDDKQKTRAQLLGELESIKDLLDEEDELLGLEPPLLTVPAENMEDAPLLTEVHQEPLAAEEAIPLLADEQFADEQLLDEQAQQKQAVESVKNAPELDSSEPQEPIAATAEEPSQPPQTTEEQPNLFEAPIGESEITAKPPAKRPSLSSGRGENPFLPKHIRDRLTANRPSQPPMVDYFAPLPAKAPPPETPSATEPPEPTPADQQLIDELVKRFLPEIEAALRERLQTVVHDERGSPKTESED